jgi:hypothetical protein
VREEAAMRFQPDPEGDRAQGGGFYVSAVKGDRWALLAGPYETHAEAKALVSTVRDLAERVASRDAWGAAFGTCRVREEADRRPGVLNERLKEEAA